MATFPLIRGRRLRSSSLLRSLAQETIINFNRLILPLFIRYGHKQKKPILSMPGHYQWSVDTVEQEIEHIVQLGIKGVILFGIPETKDEYGKVSYRPDGIIQATIQLIKRIQPNLLVIADVCLCEYTTHGHCGVISTQGIIQNDATLPLLATQALSYAQAGADIVAPSAMMDGMVQAIRITLDKANFINIPILSYAVKYASNFYGPFRQAAEGAPQFGDRRSYQMDSANCQESLRECALDLAEGGDMLMIKPAHTYLDVIAKVKQKFPAIPLGAYHTSGEFALLKAAAAQGWIKEAEAVIEVTTAIFRAGADFIITYYAKELLVTR